MFLFALFAIFALPLAISGKEKDVCGPNKKQYIDPTVNLLWTIKHENKDKKWYVSFMDETSYYNVGHIVTGHELTKGPVEAKDDYEPFHIYDHIHRKDHISVNGHVRTFKDHIKIGTFGLQSLQARSQPSDDKDLELKFDAVVVGSIDNYAIAVLCWVGQTKEQSWVVLSPKPINEEEQNKSLDFLKKKLGFERKGYSFTYQDTNDD